MKKNRIVLGIVSLVLVLVMTISGTTIYAAEKKVDLISDSDSFSMEIPEFEGASVVELDDNEPQFTAKEKRSTRTFERYSELDELGRCGVAYANISRDTMPEEERGEIGAIRPSGWHTVKYNDKISGVYAFNRCHLIAYALAGENANEENLITGFRYFNVEAMLPYEEQVLSYVKETQNHVLYRVTPIFVENELVARGVEMEAWSVEDKGQGVCYHVFVYNVQPGIGIDYETGDTWVDEEMIVDGLTDTVSDVNADHSATQKMNRYVLNTNTMKIHAPNCNSVKQMADHNKAFSDATLEELLSQGYQLCGNCHGIE